VGITLTAASGLPPLKGVIFMNTNEWALVVAVLTLIATAISTYITYKGYCTRKHSKPKPDKCEHRKSNRQSLRKITVAFSINVTKK